MIDKTEKLIPDNGFASKELFIKWAKQNVKTAVFASVAYRWIESAIKQELDKYRNVVRFPKNKNELDEGSQQKTGNYVISFMRAIEYNGKFMGIVAVDINISYFGEIILNDNKYKTMYNSIYNQNNVCVYNGRGNNYIKKDMEKVKNCDL